MKKRDPMKKRYIPKFNHKIRTRHMPHCVRYLEKEPQLVCAKCKTVFPEYLARCPECGSTEWTGLSEVNPYNHLPMEQFLKLCGHFFWFLPTLGALFLLWQTDTENFLLNEMYVLGAIALCTSGVLISVAYFGMSELTRRVERIQRRLRAFHENYRIRQRQPRGRGK